MTPNLAQTRLKEHCKEMYGFEPSPGKSKQGAGAASGGRDFEGVVRVFWDVIADCAVTSGAEGKLLSGFGKYRIRLLEQNGRQLFLPSSLTTGGDSSCPAPRAWLDRQFAVHTLVEKYPGIGDAVRRYAPDEGPYAHEKYPKMFANLTTVFDGSIVLTDNGVLREKILIECKAAKPDDAGNKMAGNAHERLAFQMMQYLEIATLYPRCSLISISNGAYVRYRNKYHVNIHVQADRLRNFVWFDMEQLSTTSQYAAFANGLLRWLSTGEDLRDS